MIESVTFVHQGVSLAGTLYLPDNAHTSVPGVISASGFGGVKEMLLPTFAEALSNAGIATLIFDYAGFGASDGEPRQHLDLSGQADQMRTALGVLADDPRIDPQRLGVWGPSMAGGHTIQLAATDDRVRCAVAIIPFVSGDSTEAPPELLEAIVADAEATATGAPPRMIPIAGHPGELAVMTSDGAWEWAQAMSRDAPNYRNEIALRSLLSLPEYRPADVADQIRIPLRAILATADSITPAAMARAALAGVDDLDIVEFSDTHFELFGEHLGETVEATVAWFRDRL